MVQFFDPVGVLYANCIVSKNALQIHHRCSFKMLDEEILSKDFARNVLGFVLDGAPVMHSDNNSELRSL